MRGKKLFVSIILIVLVMAAGSIQVADRQDAEQTAIKILINALEGMQDCGPCPAKASIVAAVKTLATQNPDSVCSTQLTKLALGTE